MPSLKWALVGVLALASSHAASPIELYTQQQSPYVEADAHGAVNGGMAVKKLQCAFGGIQQPYQLRILPWARAQQLVALGHGHGFFPASRNAERDRWAEASAPIAPQQWRWYLLNSSPLDPHSLQFRYMARVTAYHGSNMASWLDQHGYQVPDHPNSHDQLLQLLLRGRVDAVLASHLAMDALLAESRAISRVRSVLAEDKPLRVYFSKRFLATRPGFMARFNSALARCS